MLLWCTFAFSVTALREEVLSNTPQDMELAELATFFDGDSYSAAGLYGIISLSSSRNHRSAAVVENGGLESGSVPPPNYYEARRISLQLPVPSKLPSYNEAMEVSMLAAFGKFATYDPVLLFSQISGSGVLP